MKTSIIYRTKVVRCQFANLFVMFLSLRLGDQVDLVLKDENVLQLHDFNRCQVLRSLRLRARFVASCKNNNMMKDKEILDVILQEAFGVILWLTLTSWSFVSHFNLVFIAF